MVTLGHSIAMIQVKRYGGLELFPHRYSNLRNRADRAHQDRPESLQFSSRVSFQRQRDKTHPAFVGFTLT